MNKFMYYVYMSTKENTSYGLYFKLAQERITALNEREALQANVILKEVRKWLIDNKPFDNRIGSENNDN